LSLSSSSLLDSLKLLGFYYATTAGVSINIEDLKTPDIKRDIKKANQEIVDISQQWQKVLFLILNVFRVLLIVGILPNR
jgi:DNA-directed RNA polymerase beta' subunit